MASSPVQALPFKRGPSGNNGHQAPLSLRVTSSPMLLNEPKENTKRAHALEAAQIRLLRSLPPKVSCLEEAQDEVPFVNHVNEIRGKKKAPEVSIPCL